MRENIYRGKIKGQNTGNYELDWAFGDLVRELSTGKVFICDLSHFSDTTLLKDVLIEVDPETVGKFTGLTDKNGRKNFEGDIICWKDWKALERVSAVTYDPEWNRFCVWLNGAQSMGVDKHLSQDIEIVGNRWDNPELLEVSNCN